MNRKRSPLCLLLAFVLVACVPPTQTMEVSVSCALVKESRHYADPMEQRQFKEALKKAGVEHVVVMRHGKEFISWKAREHEAIARIDASLFGPPLPSGRNLSTGTLRRGEFKAWLTANGIYFTTQINRGREYVVWGEKRTPRGSTIRHSSAALILPSRGRPPGYALPPPRKSIVSRHA